jgi:hypothetical protein
MRTGASTIAVLLLLMASAASAQQGSASGTVRDETGLVLPGVTVDVRNSRGVQSTMTRTDGTYRFERLEPGRYAATFTLVNFATARRDVDIIAGRSLVIDVVLHLSLSADVTVTGKRTFANPADVENPAENLVGIALSSSQGAITARQLDARPIMRTGEVLETVPGVVISQHSGEGKANQYYLRGFNLDHGTDFATTVAGMPVNLPTHGHSHGYSDLNFLIPELVSGVQFAKGPYFADQGDFATAGSANINYVSSLDKPLVRIGGGEEGFGRVLFAASPSVASGHLLAAFEIEHNDGPWERADDYRKVNAVVRYSEGTAVDGFSITGMAYRATWNSTDQVPQRAIERGLIGRFGTLDPTDGGDTYRYSGSVEWQRTRRNATLKVTGYGIASDLNLFSNFTYYLDDPANGDQVHQKDRRFVSGGRASYRRIDKWRQWEVQNTVGIQVRNDDITDIALEHTAARVLLHTIRRDVVGETSIAAYGQNETVWTPWLRTIAGIRIDGFWFQVDASDPANGGSGQAGHTSPKGGVVIGPFKGTEFYANAGLGFHSNDVRGATITRQPMTGAPVQAVTPLVGATGAEVGVRTVAARHLQTSVTVWTLSLDSELLFVGDAGTVEPSRPSRRAGVEWANYYALRPWLVIDGDLSWSQARFTDPDPAGDHIPGAVETVASAGVAIDGLRNVFGSARWRYFGPRPLTENAAVTSRATSLMNIEGGYKLGKRARVVLDVFNVLNAMDSDIDYYYTSRLPGEPATGVDDIHLHPTLPRTARIGLQFAF